MHTNIDFSACSKTISGSDDAAAGYFQLFSSFEKICQKEDCIFGAYTAATANTIQNGCNHSKNIKITLNNKNNNKCTI
jgi:hypothetical protein